MILQLMLAAKVARVRAAAGLLLVALVPSQHFRAGYSRSRPHHPAKLPDTAHHTLHQVFTMLLGKLKAARKYTDIVVHGTMKLTAYFGVMTYCVVSRVEKLMLGQYFNDLWELYHPALSEPSVAVHPNKQALLTFWHGVTVDCPENVQLAVSHSKLTKHIAYNYILADHEDGEVVSFNRAMLPPYYAILRLCCRRSGAFAKTLAQHQNIHWAFRNIAPHAHLYPAAADELLRLARILASRGASHNNTNNSPATITTATATVSFCNINSNSTETSETREAAAFRRSTLSAYLQGLNGRTCWTTLISAFCTLVENEDDRLFVVYNGGLQMTFEALHSLHAVYVEGGGGGGGGGGSAAAAVRSELTAALRWARALCRTLRTRRDTKEARALLLACKDWPECARRLLTMLHLHPTLDRLRSKALGVLQELVMIGGAAALGALVPLAAGAAGGAGGGGPGGAGRGRARSLHGMCASRHAHHQPLAQIYRPYHKFIETCCRVARQQRCMSEPLVAVSALCALDAVPLRFNYFASFWRDVANTPADAKLEEMLLECNVLSEYIDAILLDERESLEDKAIYEFMQHYYPKIGSSSTNTVVEALTEELSDASSLRRISTLLGPLRALTLVSRRAHLDSNAARDLLRTAHAIQQRLLQATDEDSSEPETPKEPLPESSRCDSPEGSSGDEPSDDVIDDDDSSDEVAAPLRGSAYRAQLLFAVNDLAEIAQQALVDV